MLTTIQLAVDTGYRERKAEEFERAKAGAIAAGIPVIARPAVGYRQRKDRRLEPHPRVASLVREAFEMRAAGEGPTAIGEFLQSHRVKTSQGSRTWSKQAVAGLLRNRVYLGELSYGRDRRYVNPESHKPIVDLALWTAAQNPPGRLARPRTERGGYLLSGIVRCAACGYSLQGTVTSRGKHIYRCTRVHSGGVCPAPVRIPADRTETTVTEAFWSLVRDMEAHGSDDPAASLDGLQAALDKAQGALKQYMAQEVQEAIGDPALWAAGLRERREARDRAAEALGRARADQRDDEPPDVETLRGVWDTATVAERRELLAGRFDCFAVYRDPVLLAAYPTGTAPKGLPRQGFKVAPELVPFPDHPAREGAPEAVAA
jgi:hypothetical protein